MIGETDILANSVFAFKNCPAVLPMPDLPHQPQSKNKKARHTQIAVPTSKAWSGLRARDLEGLEQKICEKFQWVHSPREFQLEAIKAQLLWKDVLIHAGTGSGKTTIAAGPHAVVDKSKGMITFMVSPLLALQEEQVSRQTRIQEVLSEA